MGQVQLQLKFKVAALLFFSTLAFKSSAPYTSPDPYYLLNCGSSAPSTEDNRDFLPNTQFALSTGKHISVGEATSPTLYAAARVFTDASFYEFDINCTKTHTVRLHFLPLTDKYDLSTAVFNVSANYQFNLLNNFSATDPTTPVKKEYLIHVAAKKKRICFTPIRGLAFVSAIEVFSIPDDIIWSSEWELNFSASNQTLETLYRINVGGSPVTPSKDTMWRTWIPDDNFLASGDTSNRTTTTNPINYDPEVLTEEIAPDSVYDTCRSMASPNSNITWEFEASGHATHLLRLHFCDITSSTLDELSFNVYINDEIAFEDLKPGSLVHRFASPFLKDYTADSGPLSSRGKWLIRVSIGPPTHISWSMNGILNGLEIFKLRRGFQGFPEFETEIHVLSGIRHRHLVSLIGYCQEHSEMILVYEFMSKDTLRDHLHNSDLSWKQRLEICIGSARGLHYLHSSLARPILHRDVKSSNILLDDGFTGKVSDFGLSQVVGPSMSETYVSTGVKGSFGYFDPEYVRTRQLTTKSNVYSFGVVLLEALCARPVIVMDLLSEEINLADWAMSWHKQGLLGRTIDPSLVGEIKPNSLRMFGQIAEKCLEEYGADRPTMGDVVWNLEYAFQLQETEMAREPYEDSITTCATELPLPVIGRWPSISSVVTSHRDDDSAVARDTESESTASQVFSQFMTSEGR
ncbi:putative receptor-like protein kinase [Acorus gramineus]|uniref:Receptor-like protein kinase n=1 Tax=Acorus gramineus TaxID=55184 RepID=A0AAV9A3Y9_ACOGR|nr:putative receptor-like protein kinase [Acorus gramineus]